MIVQKNKENKINPKTEIKPADVKLKIIQHHTVLRGKIQED